MIAAVLIVSKTRMKLGVCVGAINLLTNECVRLLNPGGTNQPFGTDFEIGQVWNLEYEKRKNITYPHTEDIIIKKKDFVKVENDLNLFIKDLGITIHNGSPDILFDGLLKFTPNWGKGYISCQEELPEYSVQFWIPDKDLICRKYNNNISYYYRPSLFSDEMSLSYVGYQEAIDKIPAGTLCRVSLARCWKPDDNTEEERCYLQLSGWY